MLGMQRKEIKRQANAGVTGFFQRVHHFHTLIDIAVRFYTTLTFYGMLITYPAESQ
jgi:hypothetical protein